MEQPGSPSVKKTEEKGIIVVHEVKCKLYVKVFVHVNFVLILEAAKVDSRFCFRPSCHKYLHTT